MLQGLLEQLSSSAPPFTAERLDELVDSDAATLFVAHDDDRIVGMLTLVSFPIRPDGARGSRMWSWTTGRAAAGSACS